MNTLLSNLANGIQVYSTTLHDDTYGLSLLIPATEEYDIIRTMAERAGFDWMEVQEEDADGMLYDTFGLITDDKQLVYDMELLFSPQLAELTSENYFSLTRCEHAIDGNLVYLKESGIDFPFEYEVTVRNANGSATFSALQYHQEDSAFGTFYEAYETALNRLNK